MFWGGQGYSEGFFAGFCGGAHSRDAGAFSVGFSGGGHSTLYRFLFSSAKTSWNNLRDTLRMLGVGDAGETNNYGGFALALLSPS